VAVLLAPVWLPKFSPEGNSFTATVVLIKKAAQLSGLFYANGIMGRISAMAKGSPYSMFCREIKKARQ